MQEKVEAKPARTVATPRSDDPPVIANADSARNTESTALRLAGQGGFFVGIKRKAMPYGTIPQGQMFVQYMIPAEQRYPYPIVMVHGGGAQGTHMMGLGRRPGWVHYFVQTGYAVYWLDRPSYGRSPYQPDALGPSHLPNVPPYEPLIEATNVLKMVQWPGPGGMEDEYINQFMACESGNTADEAFHSDLVWPGGVVGDPKEFTLVDRTPPPDSPRPSASPYKLQAEPVHKWKNLQSIPIGGITSEFGAGGSPVANVEFLKQVGCRVEMLRLRDYGIYGNGNLMLMERNNHEVFTVIRDWLDKNVK